MTPTPDATGLYDEHGRWILPVSGSEVSQISVDYAFTLTIEWISIRIGTAFAVSRRGETHTYEPEDTLSLGALLDLHKVGVRDGYARKDGVLVLNFDDGTVITVEPDEQFEAFMINGSLPPMDRRFTLVALPGGGLARM